MNADPVTLALLRNRASAPPKADDPYDDMIKRQIMLRLLQRKQQDENASPMGGGGMEGLGMLNAGGGGGGGGMGGFGGGGSPWDMLFSGLGRVHGAIDGNDPNSPMVPHQRRPHGSDKALIGVGGPIGGAVGSIFGFGQSGSLAGQNVGATISDIFNGDVHNLGLDVSQNLPPIPGMKQPGWKGLVNGATGLPFGTLLGKLFG